jgi:hypothetical protein
MRRQKVKKNLSPIREGTKQLDELLLFGLQIVLIGSHAEPLILISAGRQRRDKSSLPSPSIRVGTDHRSVKDWEDSDKFLHTSKLSVRI